MSQLETEDEDPVCDQSHLANLDMLCLNTTHVRQEARVFPENKWLLSYRTMGTMDSTPLKL